MMKIINRFTGKTIYEDDADTILKTVENAVKKGANLRDANLGDADLRGADLCGANLRGAYLGDAYLRDAYLRGADMCGADLCDANLGDADLRGATYGDGIPIDVQPIYITGLRWDVLILDQHMKIGCEVHSHEDWAWYDDDRIKRMDVREALPFWNEHKDMLLALCRLHASKCAKSDIKETAS